MENNKILLLKNLKEKITKYEKNADYLDWKHEYKTVETDLFNEYTENIKIENPTYNFSVNYSQTNKIDLKKLRDYCNQNNIEIEQFYTKTNIKKITMTLKGE